MIKKLYAYNINRNLQYQNWSNITKYNPLLEGVAGGGDEENKPRKGDKKGQELRHNKS